MKPPVDAVAEFARTPVARTFPARLSQATEYLPCTADTAHVDSLVPRENCGSPTDPPLYLAALAAGGASFHPDSLRVSALAGLIWWDSKEVSLDSAVINLSRAMRLARDPVSMLVDLSAAHLVRAQRTQNSRDLVEAVEHASHALLLDRRKNLGALFNKALALQWLGIREQARLCWDAYLAEDSTSPYAEEARRRQRELPMPRSTWVPGLRTSVAEVQAFAARDPQGARELGMERELGAWGRAVLQGDGDGADAHLLLAEQLGANLADSSLAEMVRVIRGAAADRDVTARLARGHISYAEGQALIDSVKMREALEPFAKVLHERPQSPVLMLYARAHYAAALLFENRPRASAMLNSVLAEVDTARYPALAARTRWLRGTTLGKDHRYEEARAKYDSASASFRRLREYENWGATLGRAGEEAYDMGDTIAAYRLLHQAVTVLAPYRESVQLHNHLNMLAQLSVQDGMRRAADALIEEDVAVAKRLTHGALAPFEALAASATIRVLSNDTARALRDLHSAASYAKRISGAGAKESADKVLRFVRIAVRPDQASTAAFDSVVDSFAGEPVWLVPALMLRSDARLARGDTVGAAADLDSAVAYARAPESYEDEPWMRSAVLDQARGRVDRLVMLYVNAGQPLEALRALEQGRLSYAPPGRAAAVPLRSLPRAVALEYALIGDTLVTIVARNDSVYLMTHRVTQRELLRIIDRVEFAMTSRGSAGALDRLLAELYVVLVRPVENRLGARDTPLVILADGELAGIPFEALRDTARRRYLVEDHSFRFAATLADAAREAAPARPWSPALLVADPAFDRASYPELNRLEGAQREVDSLGVFYPGHIPLKDGAATRDAVLARARSAGMIHYAGHAVFDDARPERSFLLLAGADTTGRLTAREVEGMDLRGVRLVVLSACSTLRSRQGRSGGFAGFSGALLRAGAGGVVGSVWKVPDQSTPTLMAAFHRKYRDTGDPAEALRQAQMEMLKSPDPTRRSPASWAGLRYAGH